jgi:prepilin-type N-terminal cleavage/methylation domain-containing protein
MLIVVAIAAILAAISYPSYMDFVRKGWRSEGRSALMQQMQEQERLFTQVGPLPPYEGDSGDRRRGRQVHGRERQLRRARQHRQLHSADGQAEGGLLRSAGRQVSGWTARVARDATARIGRQVLAMKAFHRKATQASGFTLIELMVVVAIVAVLATVGVPSFR